MFGWQGNVEALAFAAAGILFVWNLFGLIYAFRLFRNFRRSLEANRSHLPAETSISEIQDDPLSEVQHTGGQKNVEVSPRTVGLTVLFLFLFFTLVLIAGAVIGPRLPGPVGVDDPTYERWFTRGMLIFAGVFAVLSVLNAISRSRRRRGS